VIVRGQRSSGRGRVVRELARMLGRGVLRLDPAPQAGDERFSQMAALATVFGALPMFELELGPGENAPLPRFGGFSGPWAIALGRRGGVSGPGAARCITLELETPNLAQRKQLWRELLPEASLLSLDALAARYRMPAGRLVTLARHARASAALAAREQPTLADFSACARALHREELGGFGSVLPAAGTFADLAVPNALVEELRMLELRCRHREHLAEEVARFAPTSGVRALFSGPSGTGKTLAARVLAAALGREVLRVDLAAVVNKYIGETEKNLERLLSLAEELDIVLLLDEGDSLLARRTSVGNANDRYANLETNFLLQRLESFEGIVFITTNASDRIDPAFERRMDAVLEFRMPELSERRSLWPLHLPADHAVSESMLDGLAAQCVLSGGQIRNIVLHARLLALDEGSVVHDLLLSAAVRREYKKLGSACPLRER
jgi:hypothetical protein